MSEPSDGGRTPRHQDDSVALAVPSNTVRAAASVLVPPGVFIVLAVIQLATVYDPTLVWDVTDAQAGAVLTGVSGFVSGGLVGLICRKRGRTLFAPGVAGLTAAVLAYLGFLGFDLTGAIPTGFALVGIWAAVSAALFVAVSLTGGPWSVRSRLSVFWRPVEVLC